MFLGAFSCKLKLSLSNVPSRMNTYMYMMILEKVLMPYLEKNAEITFKFQKDNAPVHFAKLTE